MDDFPKAILVILLILYIISPIDLVPGPIDDLILLLMTFGSRKGSDLPV